MQGTVSFKAVRALYCPLSMRHMYLNLQETGGTEGRVQRYEEVPQKLAQAVQDWHRDSPKLNFVLSLGDIIDGRDSQVCYPLNNYHICTCSFAAL